MGAILTTSEETASQKEVPRRKLNTITVLSANHRQEICWRKVKNPTKAEETLRSFFETRLDRHPEPPDGQ